jgi:signal transduction histidine kinase
LTADTLSAEQLADAVQEILDSIVHALRAGEGARAGALAGPTSELLDVARAHAAHRFTQRFTLKQTADEYCALRANVTRRWLRECTGQSDNVEELARFDSAVDWSLSSAIAWYDEQLKQQEEDLRAANQSQSEFLAVLSHELRNPLAPLSAGLTLLERARAQPELLDRVQPMMERQFGHLLRLVDDLLDFARINRGQISLQTAPIDLNDVVHAGAEQLAASIESRCNTLVLDLSSEPLPIVGDFARLTQVMANLLSNANRYMDPGGRIDIKSSAEADRAVVVVADVGYGIPADQLSKIFDLFSRVPEHLRRADRGFGIGLALARRLVELHGGTIEARSRGLGHGSEFVVSLPLRRTA